MEQIDAERRIGHIKRYMFGWSGVPRDGDLVMHERPDGSWVKYEDLLAEVESLLRDPIRRSPFACRYCGKDSRDTRSVLEMTSIDQDVCAEHYPKLLTELRSYFKQLVSAEPPQRTG